MVHHDLESGDDYSVGWSCNPDKILVQIASNSWREQARGVFTVAEARGLIARLEKVLADGPSERSRAIHEELRKKQGE